MKARERARGIARTMRVEWAYSAEETDHLTDIITAAIEAAVKEERERACDILDGMHCSSQVPEFKRKIKGGSDEQGE